MDTDSAIRWAKTPEARYLWVPAEPGGDYVAVDVNNRGQILFTRTTPVTDYLTQPVGKIFDPTRTGQFRMTDIKFNPGDLKLRVWRSAGYRAPTEADPVGFVDNPDYEDVPVVENAPFPPTVDTNDPPLYSTNIYVDLRALGDDGSVMANVSYRFSEKYALEAWKREGGGDYVFLWKSGAYGGCKILGEDRGFQENLKRSSGNFTAGFYTDTAASPQVHALVFDQDSSTVDERTSMSIRDYPLTAGQAGAWQPAGGIAARTTDTSMYYEFSRYQISRRGRIIFPHSFAPDNFRYITSAGQIMPEWTSFDAITELPDDQPGAQWALGSGDGLLQLRDGAGFKDSTLSGILQLDKMGTGTGNGSIEILKDKDGNETSRTPRHLWWNNHWHSLGEATGLGGTFDPAILPRKITSGGIVWAAKNDPDGKPVGNGILIPVTLMDNKEATGVDATSLTSLKTARGHQDQFWIMAPAGGSEYNNLSYLTSPGSIPSFLSISCAAASPTPSEVILDAPYAPRQPAADTPAITWYGLGDASVNNYPTYTLGNQNIQGRPIGVKTMKKRTVRVAVYPVKKSASGADVELPDKTLMTNRLNEIFGYQLNAWVEIAYMDHNGHQFVLDGDANGDGTFASDGDHPDSSSDEGRQMVDNSMFSDTAGIYDIRVILTNDPNFEHISGSGDTGLAGCTYSGNVCIVTTRSSSPVLNSPAEIIHTIGHEMGHVMIGEGHPDTYSEADLAANPARVLGALPRETGPAPYMARTGRAA